MNFPDWGQEDGRGAKKPLALYTEWAVDWERGGFALRDGAPYTVSGTEALQIWVYCALHPQSRRFACSAHSPDYGNELEELLGSGGDRGILESRLRRLFREALCVSPYITGVDGFAFTQRGSIVTVRFTVHTVYADFEQRTEVKLE